MWRAFKNADPVVKAAVISGIFLLIGAIITGAFQLIKLQTGQNSLTSSPTPTLVRTALPTPRPTDPVPTAPPLPMLVQHPSLFSNDNNNDAVSFSQPVQPGNLIIVAITQWVGGIKSVTDDQNDA